MFLIITCMITGIIIGLTLRRHHTHITGYLTTVLIWALLFMLGVSIGGNDDIFSSLTTIGLKSAVIGTAATIGSAAASWIIWRNVKDKNL